MAPEDMTSKEQMNADGEFFLELLRRHIKRLDPEFLELADRNLAGRADIHSAAVEVQMMDVTYQEIKRTRDEAREAGNVVVQAELELVIGVLMAEFSEPRATQLLYGFGMWPSASDIVVSNFGEAYLRLAKESDASGWLRGFLESDPLFKEKIGGIPEWMNLPPGT